MAGARGKIKMPPKTDTPETGPYETDPYQIDPDVQLMLRFQQGDEDGFLKLFSKYQTRIIYFCFRFCGDQTLAEDLAQDVFLRVYQGARGYRPKAKFVTWLYRIAVNVCLNDARKQKKAWLFRSLDRTNGADRMARPGAAADPDGRVPEYADESNVSAEDRMALRERDEKIKSALKKLPGEQRAAVLLRIYDDFSYREIADQMAVSEGKVKTLIFRGRQQMKEMLRDCL